MIRRRPGLGIRLFLAQILVVVTGAVTVGLVAAMVGPPLFHEHLQQAAREVGQMNPAYARHAEEAYTSASALALGVAVIMAVATAIAASAYVARRVAAPMAVLATAAADLAEGQYRVRVPVPNLGPEFDTVAAAFNQMAARLQSVEDTRRRMLTDLAHEMRTPLATIEAYLEAAEDGVAVNDEDSLQVLRTQTARLGRLADDIGAVSRAEEQIDLDLRPVSPAGLVAAAVAAALPRYAAEEVSLVERCDEHLPQVLIDPDRIGQVLGNLLDNALRHTPPGGRVTVAARAVPRAVEFEVSDTGEGIAEEHLAHVFERFYRADAARDRAHGGSGIGLAIVRAVVAAHGGGVRAASAGPGRGAVFTLTLPAVPHPSG